jgi:amidase
LFRAWRAFRFARVHGPLLHEHREQLGPNVAWNTEQGMALTTHELIRATTLRATLVQRISDFFGGVEVLACPVSQVVPFDVTQEMVVRSGATILPR